MKNHMFKRLLALAVAMVMVLGMLPELHLHAHAEGEGGEQAVTLPTTLYVGGEKVIENGAVVGATTGTGWSYDTATATLYLTDGANISTGYSLNDEEASGIYCDGVLNIHASGSVSVTSYGSGIYLPNGTLNLYAAEGAVVTISGQDTNASGIAAKNGGMVTFSGKGTVSVTSAQVGYATIGILAGDVRIDGITLNAKGSSNYQDIYAENSILVGQTEAAVVNCLGTTTNGMDSATIQKIGIYNGSTVYLSQKTRNNSWLVGLTADSIEIVDSHVIMEGLSGTNSIYAFYGNTTVSGNSHILIRKIETTGSGYGLTTSAYQLTAEQDYYCRTAADGEFALNAEVEEYGISYFELYTSSHHSYHSNGDGTHYFGCPATCPAAIRGASEACSGSDYSSNDDTHSFTCGTCGDTVTEAHSTTEERDKAATCTAPAYCSVCQSEYGEPLGHNWENGVCSNGCGTQHDPHSWENGTCTVCKLVCAHETYENGICSVCGQRKVVTVEFDYNGGQFVAGWEKADTASYSTYWGKEVTLGADPIAHFNTNAYREGYILTGWNTEPDGTGTDYGLTGTFTAQNMTIYAQWGECTHEEHTIDGCVCGLSGDSIHSFTKYVDNGDGTHDQVCTCGKVGVDNEAHSTTADGDKPATCANSAYCSVCESYYGEVDKNNHDETVAYVNGFCPYCDAYEPAELVDGVYQISNAGQLYWFAAQVNSGETAIKGKLMANIVVNAGTITAETTDAREWTPIGNIDYKYAGTFDGAGFAVSGLYCNNTDADFVGLFGNATTGSQIKYVGVVNSYIRGNEYVGGVLGDGYYSKLTGCYNTGIVSGNGYHVGGVMGSLDYGTVIACYNTGAVTGSEANVGGVAGRIEYSTMYDCYNTGTVTGTDNTSYVGGVVGNNVGSSSSYSTVSNCYNTGDVSGYKYVGGVVGCNYNAQSTVSNCYNTSSVTCNNNYSDGEIGGVVGQNYGNVRACYSLGPVSGTRIIGGVVGKNYAGATVENCYNIGSVSTIFNTSRNIGGVVGENAGTVKTSYYLTGCAADGATLQLGIGHATKGSTTADEEGVTAGMTQAQFASGEVAYLLQGSQTSQVWGQDIGTDPAPVFSDAKVYYGYTSCGDTEAGYTNEEATEEKPAHTQQPAYTDNHDGTHSAVYPCCGTTFTEPHSTTAEDDKEATCVAKAYCSVCESYYGALGGHTPDAAGYTVNADGTHSYTCTVCDATITEAHTYGDEDGTCACGLVKTYTLTLTADTVGAKIVAVNGQAVELLPGGTFTVPHGQELKVKFVNTVSQKETGVHCDAWDEDWSPIDFDYDEAINTMTIPANEVNRDIFIDAYAYVSVQFNLHGGTLTDDGRELLVERFGYTWDAETSTLKAGYSFNFALRPEYFQLAGHTLAGAKVDGSEEVVQQLKIRSDMTVDILWECDGTAILTPVPAKDATCMEAGNIAHYVCTCGKLYEDEAGTTELTAEDVKTAVDENAHSMDAATGSCRYGCGKFMAVASLTNGETVTYYSNADEAFAAVMDAQGGVVTILKDAEINEEHATYRYPVSLVVEDGATLTLNNHLYVTKKLSGTGTITANGNYEVSTYLNGEIHDITIQCRLYNGATIYSGTFNGNVRKNYGTIFGGIFYEDVRNGMDGEIRGGVFHGAVNNTGGTITGGTFNGQLINKNEEEIESMEVVSYGTIINTTPGSFVLGDDFTIENRNGIINCTAHIWKDGACRLCAEACDHQGNTNEPYADNGDGTHSLTCSVCYAAFTEEHNFENDAHKCACGVVETFTVYWALAESLGLETGTSTFGQDFVQTITVPENTHLRIDDVYLRSDSSIHVNYTYENGVLTIAAEDLPAGDIEVLCDHYIEVTFCANGGVIKPHDGYPKPGDTGFAEDGSYWIQTFAVGQAIDNFANAELSRTGYTFVEWRDASGKLYPMNVSGRVEPYILATEDVTLYAQWQCNHTIGGVVFRDNDDGTHNGYCGECDAPLGNYVERPHVYDETTHKCGCGKMETFTVTVRDNNDNIVVSLSNTAAVFGEDFVAELSSDAEKEPHYKQDGYCVNGEWYYDATYENGKLTIPAANITGDITVDVIPYVIVTFHGNGGVFQDPPTGKNDDPLVRERDYGEERRLLTERDEVREGYSFVNMNTKADGTGTAYETHTEYTYTEDLVLYAQWEVNTYTYQVETYTMDAYGNYGNPVTEEKSAAYGTTVNATPNSGAEGFYLDTQNENSLLTATVPANNDLVLKVYIGREQYPITWDLNGGRTHYNDLPESKYFGISQLDVWDSFVKEGHTFSYLEDAFGNRYVDGSPNSDYRRFYDVDMPVGGMTLKAIWTVNAYTLHVQEQSLDVNYGVSLGDALSGITPEKTGHTFKEWKFYLDEGCTEEHTGTTMPAVELYAEPVFEPVEYNITWILNGCTVNTEIGKELPETLPYTGNTNTHQLLVALNEPAGYRLEGFQDGNGNKLNYSLGNGYLFLPVTGDMIVEAVIEPMSYVATWETGDGGSYEKEFKYGETITIPTSEIFVETFRKAGHTLTGWDGYTEGMTMPIDGVTFTAVYAVNPYTITFDSDGGTAVAPITQDYGTAITAPSAPTKDGFHFSTWDPAIPETMPSEDTTLTAIWEAHKDYTYTASGDTITAFCGVCHQVVGTAKLHVTGKTYDATPVTATVTCTMEGVDAPQITYSGNINAGTYTASITLGDATAKADFTITPAVVTVRAEAASKIYGQGDPALNCTIQGLIGTDALSGSLSRAAGENVGSYAITVGTLANDNYTIDFIPANLTILPKTITVKADAVSKVYGQADPEFTYQAEGLVNGDKLTGELKREAGEDVGTYAITLGTLANSNYAIQFTGDKLTVTKAQQTITLDTGDVSLACGKSLEKAAQAEGAVTYSSSDASIVKVDASGKLTALKPGTVTITVKAAETGNYLPAQSAYTVTVSHGHIAAVTAPTCEAKGYTTYTCPCGDSYVADYTDALGHDYKGKVTLEATCTAEGVMTYTCENDASHSYTEVIPVKAHTPKAAVEENRVEATCTEKGSYEMATYCGSCGKELGRTQHTIDATGHDYDDGVITTQPGCETEGIKTFTCVNDKSHTYTEKVAPTGHSPKAAVEENRVEATCTEKGSYEQATYCGTCGKELGRTQHEIPAKGHSFGSWTVVKAATCTEKGLERRDCNNCDHYETRATAFTGHSYRDAMDPSCEVCGEHRAVYVESIPMLRLYNPVTGEHHYTGSAEERDTLVSLGWNYEGVAWNAPVEFGDPVCRYYNPNTGDHHYTMCGIEGNNLVDEGWIYEGVAWNSASSEHLPIYRLYNPNAEIGAHHYTGSAEERDNLVEAGWKYEGIGWYALLY